MTEAQTRVNFRSFEDAGFDKTLTLTNQSDGSVIDLTGSTFQMNIRDSVASPIATLTLTEANSRIVNGTTAGTVQLIINEDDLVSSLNYNQFYTYDLQWTNSDGAVTYPVAGTFVRSRSNTRDGDNSNGPNFIPVVINYTVTSLTNSDSPYDATVNDAMIVADTTDGSITVNLPAASSSSGRVISFKKTSASNSLVIDGDSSETIDGSTTKTLTSNDDFTQLLCDGTEWHVMEPTSAGGGATQLTELSDVTTAAVTDKFVLAADGAAYVGRALVEADISDFGTYVSDSGSVTLTNKTIDGDNNTISNLDIGNEVDWATISDVDDRTAFASGDKVLIFEAGVGMRKVDYDDLPGAGGGLSNVVEDTTPQLGGDLDLNSNLVGDASAADLTKLSEVTATSTELNYVDGVTSSIQDQIDQQAEVVGIAVTDETTAVTAGTGKITFRMPFAMTLTGVRASLSGAGSTSGTTTVDINEGGSTILSTKLSIDQGEKTSTTAATAAVISDSALADDAEITIDVDAVTGGADETGLKVYLIGTRT